MVVVFALLFTPSAGAAVVSTSGDTMLIEFLGEVDISTGDESTGYFNVFIANEEDWDLNGVPLHLSSISTLPGEYYEPDPPPWF